MSENNKLIAGLIDNYYEDIIGAYKMIKENSQLNKYINKKQGESIKNISSNTNYLYGISNEAKQNLVGVPLFLIKTYINMILQTDNSSYKYHTIISDIKIKTLHTDEDQLNYFLAAWLMARAEIEKCSRMGIRGGKSCRHRYKKNKNKRRTTQKNK